MNKIRTPKRSRLGIRLLVVIILSIFAAIIMFVTVIRLATVFQWWSSPFVDEVYSQNLIESAVTQLQEYVTANNIISGDYQKLRPWLSRSQGVGFVFGPVTNTETPYMITFSDQT